MKTLSLTVSWLCLWVALFLTGDGQSQSLESGVVKVSAKGEGTRKTGTGFIVRLSEDSVYIMTAAHVVEGDSQPEIEFFTRRNVAVTARIVEQEGGEERGLALLVVSGRTNLPAGLEVPPLAPSLDVKGGDSVTAIGFPRMAGPWALIRGSIVSRQGRDIIFDGAIDEGNSGGPLIKDGQVVGLITGLSGRFGRATPAAIVRLFIEGSGVEPGQIAQPAVRAAPSPNSTGRVSDQYCIYINLSRRCRGSKETDRRYYEVASSWRHQGSHCARRGFGSLRLWRLVRESLWRTVGSHAGHSFERNGLTSWRFGARPDVLRAGSTGSYGRPSAAVYGTGQRRYRVSESSHGPNEEARTDLLGPAP